MPQHTYPPGKPSEWYYTLAITDKRTGYLLRFETIPYMIGLDRNENEAKHLFERALEAIDRSREVVTLTDPYGDVIHCQPW